MSDENEKLVGDMGHETMSTTQMQTAVFQSGGNLF